MPFLGGGESPLSQLQTILQIQRARQQDERQKALDLIGRAQPGQTVEQLGLSPKMFKNVYGRAPQAGEVLKPLTPDEIMRQRTVSVLQMLPADTINNLALSAVNRETTGQGGLVTPNVLKTRAATSETQATGENVQAGTQLAQLRSISDLVDEGIQTVKALPSAKRSALGQKMAYGQTAAEAQEADIGATLKSELTRQALLFTADPQNHPLGKLLKSRLGMDPVAVMTSTVLGTNQLLDQMAQLQYSSAMARSALETELAKSAGDLSKLTGYKINPADIMAVWTETDPKKRAKLGPIAQIMEQTSAIVGRAALTEAAMKGDPRMIAMSQAVDAARQIKDPSSVAAVSEVMRGTMSTLMAEQVLGPRPSNVGQDQARWDQIRAGYQNILPGFDSKGFFSHSLTPSAPIQTPATTLTAPRDAVPSPKTGTVAPKSITVPAGATPDDVDVLQKIIDSLYKKP